MGRLSTSMITFALGIATALGLLACGEGGDADLLPGSTAGQINSNLDQVEQLVAAGDCVGAGDAADEVGTQIEELSGVDRRLKRALGEGAERLQEVVATCEETTTEETEAVVEPEEEPETTETEKADEEEEERDEEKEKSRGEAEQKPDEPTESPSQSEGKAKGQEKSETTPAEPGGGAEEPSGGISPGAPAGGE